MHNQQLDNPFWQYSCELYQKPGVRDILLLLQDKHNLNINLLLLMSWLGENKISINNEQLKILVDCIEQVDSNIIQPLRQIRQTIKSNHSLPADYYEQFKQLELNLEQLIIQKLYDNSFNISQAIVNTPCVKHNIDCYIENYSIDNDSTNTSKEITSQKEALLKALYDAKK